MQLIVSKSQFKPKALEYLRAVEKFKEPLIITHEGKPVVEVVPYAKQKKHALQELAGTVIEYKDPTQPVGENSWEVLQ